MKKAVLQIEALNCPSCMVKIQVHLEKLPGVKKVKVFYSTGKAVVSFAENVVTVEQLKEAVKHLGYSVTKITTG